MSEPTQASRRINVSLSDAIYKMLEDLSRKTGKSYSEILRDAIALEKWVDEERERGGCIMAKRGEEVRELVIR